MRVSDEYSTKHPHPDNAIDSEGRCLWCVALVAIEQLRKERDEAINTVNKMDALCDRIIGATGMVIGPDVKTWGHAQQLADEARQIARELLDKLLADQGERATT